jgi:hypothetical protein
MAFTKGHSKIGGRRKGMPNRCTSDFKAILRQAVEDELLSLSTTFKAVKSPERRLELFIKLLPFVIPKAQEVSLELLPNHKLDNILECLSND